MMDNIFYLAELTTCISMMGKRYEPLENALLRSMWSTHIIHLPNVNFFLSLAPSPLRYIPHRGVDVQLRTCHYGVDIVHLIQGNNEEISVRFKKINDISFRGVREISF